MIRFWKKCPNTEERKTLEDYALELNQVGNDMIRAMNNEEDQIFEQHELKAVEKQTKLIKEVCNCMQEVIKRNDPEVKERPTVEVDVNGDEEVEKLDMKEIEEALEKITNIADKRLLKKQVERMEVIELNAKKSLETNKEKMSSQLEDGQIKMEKSYKQVQEYIDKIIGRKKQDGSYGEYKDFICEATAMVMEKQQKLGDMFDEAIAKKKVKEIAEKKKVENVKSLKVVAPLVPWKKGESFEQYKQHLELYDSVNEKVSDPRTRFLAVMSMLKAEGHLEEATNVQETLRHKVGDKDIVEQMIKTLSEMSERSKPEKAKQSLAKLLDQRKDTEEDVNSAIAKFRNNVTEWEAVSKVPLDGLLKINLLFRTLCVTEQIEGNIRTKVDLNQVNYDKMYNEVEMAIKDLAGNIKPLGTYLINNWRQDYKVVERG